MEKLIRKKYPKYLKEFKCIGGECEDSCCIGWDIDIDKITFRQYYKVKDQEMKKMFQKNVHNNEYCQAPDVDYGKVKLKKDKRCPFLDECNYCIIQSKLGEEYLSNVCTSFPRILNKIDGYYEMSLDVSCPEAARILLLKEEGIEFEENEENLGKHIISSEIDTKSKEFKNLPIKYFKEIRDLSIKIIKNRKFDLSRRLYILGEFINELEEELKYNYENVQRFIKEYDINSVKDPYEKDDFSYLLQVDFFKKTMKYLNILNEVDSLLFKDYTKEVMTGFNFEDDNISKYANVYIEAFEEYSKEYMIKNSFIFENYLVNFIYNYMFPFSENQSVFDGYIMLLMRYSFIRFYLVGKYIVNKNESKEEIVRFIQVFSKSIGHHRNYLVNLLKYIKEKEFNNIEFVKIHLPMM
ncbi:FliB family protein [Clostridium baratii]|uniref:flagellin lysine-N-methylase n=1 Tax=Clostridium baratii TaxID=1561 RepID=UPI0009A281AC|nr:flagellin lysine-N-methylase [Clostridium baratii]OPF50744.1 FliB family protein [Clostridium baratii]OPF54011.1 FliB family protein [Clostridium baratii]OPF58575.1 FliB family protein [Clostridium baratii]OPF59053.1 FliB family protein [Clostridium baratii]